jgi:hypothetical protein
MNDAFFLYGILFLSNLLSFYLGQDTANRETLTVFKKIIISIHSLTLIVLACLMIYTLF